MNIFKPSHGIAFDIDGIVLDTATHIWEGVNKHFGLNRSIDEWTQYDIETIVDKSIDELRPVYEPILAKNDIPLVDGAKQALQWLHAKFPEEALLFITARRLQFKDSAVNSLRAGLGPDVPFEVICTMERHVEHRSVKLEILQEHGITFFIDDNPHYWKKYLDAGIKIGTLAWPWTKGEFNKDIYKYTDLIMFYSWEEVLYHFEEIGLNGRTDASRQ